MGLFIKGLCAWVQSRLDPCLKNRTEPMAVARSSWWQCNTLCTSGFVDDVMFHVTGPIQIPVVTGEVALLNCAPRGQSLLLLIALLLLLMVLCRMRKTLVGMRKRERDVLTRWGKTVQRSVSLLTLSLTHLSFPSFPTLFATLPLLSDF